MQIILKLFTYIIVIFYICTMEVIRDLKKLYTANHDNEVVIFATNLKSFVDALANIEPNARNYAYYDREFKKISVLDFVGDSGKSYKLQKVFERE